MRNLLTSQIQPSGSDSIGYWIDLKLHALTYFEPYFTKIQNRTWIDLPRLQTNDFLIINFFMKNPKNFNDVKPYHKLHTSLESSPRAERCQIFQKLYFGNVQFRKSNFIFTINRDPRTANNVHVQVGQGFSCYEFSLNFRFLRSFNYKLIFEWDFAK